MDYVVRTASKLWAIEVKSGRARNAKGLAAFLTRYPDARPLILEMANGSLEKAMLEDLE